VTFASVPPPGDVELLKARVHARLPADAVGRISYIARANAIESRVHRSARERAP
jgi:hypothetical protein